MRRTDPIGPHRRTWSRTREIAAGGAQTHAHLRLQGIGGAVRPARPARLRHRMPSRPGSTASSSATTSSRGATPTATPRTRSPGSARSPSAPRRVTLGTSVAHPDVPLPPGHRRPGARDARPASPRPRVVLGVGHRRVAQRGPARHRVAGPEGAVRPPQGGDRADPAPLDRGLRHVSTAQFYKTDNATIYDKPGEPVPLYIAASGPAAARLAGRIADGFICTPARAWSSTPRRSLPAVAEGAEKAGRSPDDDREDDRDEGLVRLRPAAGPRGHPGSGRRSRCPSEAKIGVDDPREMERLASELPIEQVGHAAGSSRTTPTSTSSRSGRTSSLASPTWCSTRRATTSRASSTPTRGTSCRA